MKIKQYSRRQLQEALKRVRETPKPPNDYADAAFFLYALSKTNPAQAENVVIETVESE